MEKDMTEDVDVCEYNDIEKDPLFDNDPLSVDEVRLIGIRQMTVRELFGGYDTLHAITFSMETGFLDRITELFEYSECIIGADYMARKNRSLHDAFYWAATHAAASEQEVAKYPALGMRIMQGQVKIKASNVVLDHRKRYILEGPAGTRVITTSANMSGRAWTGSQLEHYAYDDSREAYDRAMDEFNAAWGCCADIPYRAGIEKKEDRILDNPLVKNMIRVNNMAVIPATEPEGDAKKVQLVEYAMLADERYDEFFKSMEAVFKKAKIENGHYVISYNNLKKASDALKANVERKRVIAERIVKQYPTMSFDYNAANPGMLISGKPVDMAFDMDAARADGVLILEAFSHFEEGHEFTGDLDGLQDGHWRSMCYLFASPHIGRLKYHAYVCGMDPTSLPLYMILGSRGPDTGKTFMMEFLLAAMTGLHNIKFKKGNTASTDEKSFIGDMRAVQGAAGMQGVHEGTPYVYDELVSSTVRSVKNLIKEFDSSGAREGTPALVFTTNDLVDPDSLVRKRAIYIPFDASIRSSVDKNEFKSVGEQMKRGFTGAFYREFTRRYILRVMAMEDVMYSDGRPKGWYPDIMPDVSGIILDLFHDLGLEPAACMRQLTWNGDYYADNKNAERAFKMLNRMWAADQEKFRLSRGTVRVYFGTDSSSQKKAIGIANMLPAELGAKAETYRDEGAILTFDRQEGERFGLSFRRGLLDRFRR